MMPLVEVVRCITTSDETVETVVLDVVELIDRAGECERTEEVSEGSCRKRRPLASIMMTGGTWLPETMVGDLFLFAIDILDC